MDSSRIFDPQLDLHQPVGADTGIDWIVNSVLAEAARRSPEHRLVSVEDVASLAVFSVSDAAASLTGNVDYIDGGYHMVGWPPGRAKSCAPSASNGVCRLAQTRYRDVTSWLQLIELKPHFPKRA
jgi:hypothetical protein